MNYKNFTAGILCAAGMTGCLKPESFRATYTYEPGIVTLDLEVMGMMFATNSGSFYVPELNESASPYGSGDVLLADFVYDEKNQPYRNVATVSDFKVIQKMDVLTFQQVAEEGLADDFSDPLTEGGYTGKGVGYYLIFGFIPVDKTVIYEYEMLYIGEIAHSMKIYLKARKTNIPATGDIYYTAVNIEPFIKRCQEQYLSSVDIIFMTKTGNGNGGSDNDYTQNSSVSLNIPPATE
jgi:hypothetical protein